MKAPIKTCGSGWFSYPREAKQCTLSFSMHRKYYGHNNDMDFSLYKNCGVL